MSYYVTDNRGTCSIDSTKEIISKISKQVVRKKVWDYLKKNDFSRFPRPVHRRIPNFKDSEKAANKLAELDIFKMAKVIKVNPDKPQEAVRVLALQAKKDVLVPIPRLHTRLLQLLEVPGDAGYEEIKIAATLRGAEQFDKPLGLDAKIKVDLVVMGAVAVSKEGRRIGKGEGFADLEFAIMANMGAVTADTIVVTTVSDSQIFETLPDELFKPYDVPVDVIVTPTEVYTVSRRLPKPDGIIWGLLSSRRLNNIPILQTLLEERIWDGDCCILKEVDSDVEEHEEKERTGSGLKRSKKVDDFMEEVQMPYKPEMGKRKGLVLDFSIRVVNIGSRVKMCDMKSAVAKCGVRPTAVTWCGFNGYAFLHFTKKWRAKDSTSDTKRPKSRVFMDKTIAALQDIRLGAYWQNDFKLEFEPYMLC